MAKSNKRRRTDVKTTKPSHSGTRQSSSRVGKSISKPSHSHQSKSKPHVQNQHKPSIPFVRPDNILLVGEGDFSFAYSLVRHHRDKFNSLCATCFDSREELLEKYPQAEQYITRILANPEESNPKSIEAIGTSNTNNDDIDSVPEDDVSNIPSEDDGDPPKNKTLGKSPSSVLYSVDATALSKQKYIRTRKWDRIVFNFPHVGGKSTDVNRQVRYNQALLHSFFQAAKPLLLRPHGTILVTLFEGSPYDLWNIRDLIRSAGLRVIRSFAFDSSLYPGYAHARTLGNIHSREASNEDAKGDGKQEISGDVATGEEDQEVADDTVGVVSPGKVRPGEWRGEERKARTYEFGLTEQDARGNAGTKRKRKRKGQEGESSDEGV